MANLAAVLKEEIRRLARIEVRANTKNLIGQTRKLRESNKTLKAEVKELQGQVKGLLKELDKFEVVEEEGAELEKARFTGKGIRSMRKRMGLTLAELGQLTGVTGPAVYNWEKNTGVLRRLKANTAAKLTELRGIGKKEAQARLEG